MSETWRSEDYSDAGEDASPQRITETHRLRQWHDRIKLDNTVKDGFRVSEIVVSCDYEEGDAPAPFDYRYRVDELFNAIQPEVDLLNQKINRPGQG